MELKPSWNNMESTTMLVLIVPYGIETREKAVSTRTITVLIVPYGIETESNINRETVVLFVLIVPYGIETKNQKRQLQM